MKNWTIDDFPMKKWKSPKDLIYKGNWIYNWFSNFELTPIECNGMLFPSVENYYQFSKIDNPTLIETKQFTSITPSNAKQLGRRIKIRNDWEHIKFNVMFTGLITKIKQHSDFKAKLLATEGDIIEWNNWNDKTWGVSIADDQGRNALGVMLMYLRDYFQN